MASTVVALLLLRLLLALALALVAAAPEAYQALLLQQGDIRPSARKQAAAAAGWLFGGTDGGVARNDLWQYAASGSDGWSHLGGEGSGQRGVYSNLGGAAFVDPAAAPAPPVPWPGGRAGATLFSVDVSETGSLYLFGGHGTGGSGRTGYLNDLWIFMGAQDGWVWWGGSDEVDQPSTLCPAQGTECQQLCPSTGGNADSIALVACSWPGGRRSAAFWQAQHDSVYMFGGVGCDAFSCHAFHSLNDLWWYADDAFHFIQGSLRANEVGRYPGTLGTSATSHQFIWPGSRSAASGWYDPVAKTGVIFGGKGCDAVECASYSYLNDLWAFEYLEQPQTSHANSSTLQAEFLGGSLSCNSDGNFPDEGGQQHEPPWPGARESPATWVDSDGNAYIFGGSGFDEVGDAVSALSDLWQWNTFAQSWRWVGGPSYGNEVSFGVNLVWPGARGQAAVWYDSDSEVATIFGGKQAEGTSLLDELWQFVPDEYAVCSAMSLADVIDLPAFADVSRCDLSSTQRCVVSACSTNYVASGTGQVVCIVDAGVASLVFESVDSFSCIRCVEQPAVVVSCTASTEYAASYSCEKVYDGNYRRDAGEWSTAGEGGGWVKLDFDGTYRIDRMDFQQRWREMDWATSISIDFSDGSSQSMDLQQSPAMHAYWLDPVFTNTVRIEFTGVRASYSNVGATEIREFLVLQDPDLAS